MATSQECLPPFRSTMGLLTTVSQLPQKYKIRYLTQTVVESPLDLSVRQIAASTEVTNINNGPMTPPPSPPKKRYREEDFTSDETGSTEVPEAKCIKTEIELTIKKEVTPRKPIKVTSAPKTSKSHTNPPREKKSKAIRKLKFDEETSSPVSGTIIRPLEEIGDNPMDQSGDIDPEYNVVEVTEEAKAELASIKNVIGAYMCKLCRIEFEDAFGLARHRCSCIVLLEYRCPECGKRFNCPANLASHRRWHKPKDQIFKKQSENVENEQHTCSECGKSFKRQAYLRKHMMTHKSAISSTSSTGTASAKESQGSGTSDQSPRSSSVGNYRTDDSNSRDDSLSRHSIQTPNPYRNDSAYYRYDSDLESHSDCSSPGRLHIIENNLTEEENIAAAALAHLRNGPSVIQHTTALAY